MLFFLAFLQSHIGISYLLCIFIYLNHNKMDIRQKNQNVIFDSRKCLEFFKFLVDRSEILFVFTKYNGRNEVRLIRNYKIITR